MADLDLLMRGFASKGLAPTDVRSSIEVKDGIIERTETKTYSYDKVAYIKQLEVAIKGDTANIAQLAAKIAQLNARVKANQDLLDQTR